MKQEVFGVKIDDLTMDEALENIKDFLVSDKQHYIVLPYSEFIVRAQKDEEFRNILNQADLCLCESRGLWLMARLIGKRLKKNIYGVDLIYEILNTKYELQKIFLLGGKPDIAEKASKKINANIVGIANGYQDFDKVIKEINKAKPDILLVGLGSPKQEKWIYENLKKMPSVKLAIGVGGAFDFISGRIRRAPEFIQKIGFEWFWRWARQPWRIKRICYSVLGLVYLVIHNYFVKR